MLLGVVHESVLESGHILGTILCLGVVHELVLESERILVTILCSISL